MLDFLYGLIINDIVSAFKKILDDKCKKIMYNKKNTFFGVGILDNRYYEQVIAEMRPFLDEHGFVSRDDGSFRGEAKAFKVEYSEPRQMYLLLGADVTDGEPGEFSELSAWLFDDTQTAKDAGSVGVDFTATIRDTLGIKIKRAPLSDVDLPSADKNGALTVSGFTKKVLDVFPQFKDAYKEHVAQYGNFLYLNFYGETLVPQIKAVLRENTKKGKKKLFDLMETGYLSGDRETVNAVVAVLAAAAYGDEEMKALVLDAVAEDKHMQSSVAGLIPMLDKRKKLHDALIK